MLRYGGMQVFNYVYNVSVITWLHVSKWMQKATYQKVYCGRKIQLVFSLSKFLCLGDTYFAHFVIVDVYVSID